MERSRTPLRKWFVAIYLFSDARSGLNAVRLSQAIKVTYKTAWLMLHKLREALIREDNERLLDGIVRVQGGAYGAPFNPYTEKDPQRHPLLAGGSVCDTGEVANLRLTIVEPQHIQDNGYISHLGEQAFIRRNVSSTASEVQSLRFRLHMSRFRPLVRCIADFGHWASATYRGLGRQYLQAYANEFTFRYNSRHQGDSMLARIFQLCASTASAPSLRSITLKYRLS